MDAHDQKHNHRKTVQQRTAEGTAILAGTMGQWED